MLSDRQKELLNCIEKWLINREYAPSIREMMVQTGIPSTSVVAYNLERLKRYGYIELDPVARGIRLKRGSDGKRREMRIEVVDDALV